MARFMQFVVAAVLVACPRQAWCDVGQLLEENQRLRDRIFTIRATVVEQGTAGLPLPTNRKYIYEIEWLQKGDLIRVDDVIGEVRDVKRIVSPKQTFVYRDRTRRVFHIDPGGPNGPTNIVQIDPPHEPVPPHSVWRLAVFELWSNRFDDPRGPGRVSYRQAAQSPAAVGLARVEEIGPRTLLFVMNDNATEEIVLDDSGLIVSQVIMNPSGEH